MRVRMLPQSPAIHFVLILSWGAGESFPWYVLIFCSTRQLHRSSITDLARIALFCAVINLSMNVGISLLEFYLYFINRSVRHSCWYWLKLTISGGSCSVCHKIIQIRALNGWCWLCRHSWKIDETIAFLMLKGDTLLCWVSFQEFHWKSPCADRFFLDCQSVDGKVNWKRRDKATTKQAQFFKASLQNAVFI